MTRSTSNASIAERWDRFVAASPGAWSAHRHGWQSVIEEAFGHQCHYLVEREEDGVIAGVLPLAHVSSRLFGSYLVSMSCLNYGGVLARSQEVEQELLSRAVNLASDLGASHFELRETKPRDGWPSRTDKVAMELALPDSHEALLKNVGAKVRSQIKRPLREGANVVQGGAELLDEFYAVFSRNMRDLGTPVYAKRFFALVLEAFPADSRIFVVRVGGKPAAAGLVMGFRKRLEIPWASSLREYNRIGVNMLLYSEVLRYAIEAGYEIFDFGRSSKDAGTYRFKAQWGAEPRQLYWNYWLAPGTEMPGLTPSNPKFQFAIRMWQKLPVPVANLLGPHIVRGLP